MIFALFVLFILPLALAQMLWAQTPPATQPPAQTPPAPQTQAQAPTSAPATPAPATKPSETESVPTAWAPALDRVPDADRQNVLEALKLAGGNASTLVNVLLSVPDAWIPASLSASRTF